MKPPIQSLHNLTIKRVIKLRDARTRRELQRFLIDGQREIERAVAAGFQIDCIYLPDNGSGDAEEERALLGSGLPHELLQPVSAAVMRKLAYGDRDSDMVAVAHYPPLELSRIQLSSPALVLVLDGIEKPGNLGACMRTAAAAGAQAVVLTNPVCDVFNPNAIRASRGTLFCLPIAVASPPEVISWCVNQQIQIFTARVDGNSTHWEANFAGSAAVVFGSESHGLDEAWPTPPCNSFRIPMSHTTDSLNVSISAALTLYEAVRQRQSHTIPAV